MKEPVVTIRNLTKAYPLYRKPSDRLKEVLFPWREQHVLFYALQNVSFDLYRGEHLGIIGTNGAGKSTLLQIVTGVLTPTSGSVACNGSVAALLELGAGFNMEMTGRENITFITEINGLPKKHSAKIIEDIIFFADIGQFIDQPVKTYSSGMFVRLAFALNIAVSPDILIIDEALAVGDIFFQQKCMRRMKEYREKGTIIFVSHDTPTIINLCTKTLWLENGTVREYGDSKEVCDHYLASFHETVGRHYEDMSLKEADVAACKASSLHEVTGDRRLNELRLNPIGRFDRHDSFGTMEGKILDAVLEDHAGHSLTVLNGGENCHIRIYFSLSDPYEHIVVGFVVKDRLGQNIFGTNTLDEYGYLRSISPGVCGVEFFFTMPMIISGDYTVAIALSKGDCNTYKQLHWIHDALLFSVKRINDRGVLFYSPMTSVHQLN